MLESLHVNIPAGVNIIYDIVSATLTQTTYSGTVLSCNTNRRSTLLVLMKFNMGTNASGSRSMNIYENISVWRREWYHLINVAQQCSETIHYRRWLKFFSALQCYAPKKKMRVKRHATPQMLLTILVSHCLATSIQAPATQRKVYSVIILL